MQASAPPKETPSARSLAQGVVFSAANYALAFVTVVVLARWLGPKGYGDYAVGVAVATSLAIPTSLGLQKLVLKSLPVYANDNQWGHVRGLMAAGWICIAAAGAVVALLLWGGLELFHGHTGLPRHSVLVAAIFTGPLVAMGIYGVEVLNANRLFTYGTGVRMVFHPGVLLALIVIAHLAASRFTPALAFWCFSLAGLIAVSIAAVLIRRMSAKEIWQKRPRFEFVQWVGASVPFVFNSLVTRALRRTGILLLELLSPLEDEVGLYAAVAMISSFVIMLVPLVNSHFLPRISPLLKAGDTSGVNLLLQRRLWFLCICSLVFFLSLAIWGRHILGLFHQEFVRGYHLLLVFSLSACVTALMAVAPLLLQFLGETRLVGKQYAAVLAAAVGLTALLVPWLRALGAVLGFALPFAAMLIIQMRRLARDHGIWVIPFHKTQEIH